jgi:hypothetical protein
MLTAAAGIISATTGLVVALNQTGIFRSRTAPAPAPASAPASAPPRAPAADVNGAWKAQVTYSWGITRPERFVFQADNERLRGTVTFLGVPRGIEAGVIEGDRLTFTVRTEEMLGSERRPVQFSYTGTAVGGGIHFVLEDSRGNPSVQFAAERDLSLP